MFSIAYKYIALFYVKVVIIDASFRFILCPGDTLLA